VGACGAVVHNSPCSEAAEQAGKAARGGETAATKTGRRAHDNYRNALGGEYRFTERLPSGLKPDAVDYKNSVVRELKPDNPRAIRRGARQVERYRRELEAMTERVWQGIVDTYRGGGG
jgi:hypothetical protein